MLHIFFFLPFIVLAQNTSFLRRTREESKHFNAIDSADVKTPINRKRLYLISGIHVAGYPGTMYLLSEAWYQDFPRTTFHTFNDAKEWLQVDKVGHAWTAYNIAKYSKGMWLWAGIDDKKAAWLGSFSSLGYQTILEILDAHSTEWGWSWSDMGANVMGIGTYLSQEITWKEQRVQFKFSTHRNRYAPDLNTRANALYGNTLPARLLKDYNGQTYWLSMNLKSFTIAGNLPPWLNISVGYGAKGLFGGFENIGLDKSGNMIFNRPDIKRERQWYIAPDIDFTKIKTNKKLVRSAFSFLNMLKMPAPALELSGGKIKGRLLVF